ncbi:unnamed protein product [Schistosoma curassoni]|uniref:DUF1758 domain-containing protein n=1 Tax=Schistosoma curassoni TaxID=6186 RepID=A0A183JG61_9TREM|nr:unnamed protein product [Schistosoma curassoni]
MIGDSQHETLDVDFVLLSSCQQSVPIILRELMLPDGFNPVSPRLTVRDVTIGTPCRRVLSSTKLSFIVCR